jgi:hypothetical protein
VCFWRFETLSGGPGRKCARDGGLTPKKLAAREWPRLETAERFARGEKPRDATSELRGGKRQVEK